MRMRNQKDGMDGGDMSRVGFVVKMEAGVMAVRSDL